MVPRQQSTHTHFATLYFGQLNPMLQYIIGFPIESEPFHASAAPSFPPAHIEDASTLCRAMPWGKDRWHQGKL